VPKLSVILITRDEAAHLAGAIESVRWADEIVVVDSGSSDGTVVIAERLGARVTYREWDGYAAQKNHAAMLASHDWILSLDADERVTPELAEEIIKTIAKPSHDAYLVKRKNIYRGTWVRRSGWWPDEVLRLFRRGKARFNDRIVHESLEFKGRHGTLENPLEHHSYYCAGDFISRVDRYSTLGARMLKKRGKKAGTASVLARTVIAFLRSYIFKKGFLDGRAGLLIAFSTAEVTFYKYMKLLEADEKR